MTRRTVPPGPHYRVETPAPRTRRFQVTLTLGRPDAEQGLWMPAWVPGSYLVRDMARHVGPIEATQAGRPCAVRAVAKSRWAVATDPGSTAPLVLRYEVHATDPSVRGATLDEERGFFNPSSLCVAAAGREERPHRLTLARLPRAWQVATPMRPVAGARRAFEAGSYAELIDHPFELGRFWRGGFEVGGAAHEVALAGAWPGLDGGRLLADLAKVCREVQQLWHGRGRPPFDRYVFLVRAGDEGSGGLEHRDGCALGCRRAWLPRRGADPDAGYRRLLGLAAHEYFHAWNAKRLAAPALLAPDLLREADTRGLWFVEGVTSYYDELTLRRAGQVDAPGYLSLLAAQVNAVLATPGRWRASVAQAGFDAWTRLYRSDEHTPNTTVDYYAKGALVALCLDLTLRLEAGRPLDDVLRRLWRRHGRAEGAVAVGEPQIADALQAVAGRSMRPELDRWVHGTDELPLADLLGRFGVAVRTSAPDLAAVWGLRVSEGPVTGVRVTSVLRDGAAEAAGVQAGDELLAVDGWRIRRLDEARAWVQAAGAAELLLVRDQRVRRCTLRAPTAPSHAPVRLEIDAAAGDDARRARLAWIGG